MKFCNVYKDFSFSFSLFCLNNSSVFRTQFPLTLNRFIHICTYVLAIQNQQNNEYRINKVAMHFLTIMINIITNMKLTLAWDFNTWDTPIHLIITVATSQEPGYFAFNFSCLAKRYLSPENWDVSFTWSMLRWVGLPYEYA